MTVVFADIVGSTAHTTAHEPELVRAVLNDAFERLRALLEANGGTVEKFIGDAVVAVFGVPKLHEDDAERAVRSALAMRVAIAELNTRSPLSIELRIGVNSGQVLAEAIAAGTNPAVGVVTGEPVVVAARLQQSALPGEVLVGRLTYELTRETIEFGQVRQISAKGVSDVDAWPALGRRRVTSGQEREVAGLHADLIGRDGELRQLFDVYRRLANDRPAQLVTVFGNAGTGKSRLAAEFLATVRPAVVLRGRSFAYGSGPLWPLREMLHADASISLDDARDEALMKWRRRVLSTFGKTSEDAKVIANALAPIVLGSSDAEVTRQERHWAVRKYLERRASRGPLVLVFEDLHWAEPPLIDLIEDLADRVHAPVLMLCLARPELLETRPEWAGGKRNAMSVDLAPLRGNEVRRLVVELLGGDPLPARVKAHIESRAEGNPLYVEELLRSLIDRGSLALADGQWVQRNEITQLDVPPTIHALIAARLDRLDPAVRSLLQRAAVIGKVFWTDALGAIATAEAIDDLIGEAERLGLIRETDQRGLRGGSEYRFSHVLVRDVVYSSIPKDQRGQLHDALGHWIASAAGERGDEYVEIIAKHGELAYVLTREIGSDAYDLGERAIQLLVRAGTKAKDLDLRAALDLYERAKAIAHQIGVGQKLLARLTAEATLLKFRTGAMDEASLKAVDEAIEQARVHAPDELLFDLINERLWYVTNEQQVRSLIDILYEAARATSDATLMARAMRLQSRYLLTVTGDVDAGLRILREAAVYARQRGAHQELHTCLYLTGFWTQYRGELTQAVDLFKQAEAARVEPRTLGDETADLVNGSDRAYLCGDLERAIALRERLLQLARDLNNPRLVRGALHKLGLWLGESGELQRALETLREALTLAPKETDPAFYPEILWSLAQASLRTGRLDEARQLAEEAFASALPDDLHALTNTRLALAEVRAAEGRHVDAEVLYREAVEGADRGRWLHVQIWVRSSYARWLISRGHHSEARRVLEALAEHLGDPLLARRLSQVKDLIRQCDAIPSS